MSLSKKILCAIGLILYENFHENIPKIEKPKEAKPHPKNGKEKKNIKPNVKKKVEKKVVKRKDKKRLWMKGWLMKRNKPSPGDQISNASSMPQILNEFHELFHMNPAVFADLLSLVGPFIQKKNTLLRESIATEQRLLIALRFLKTGATYEDMKHSSLVSSQAIGKIVMETSEAIIQVFSSYIQIPKTQEEWKRLAKGFQENCNFPHCLGVVDGRHIPIKKPSYTKACYINYKRFCSIILMGVINSNYEFIVVEAGVTGSISDDGVLPHTEFGKEFYGNSLNLPEPSCLPDKANKYPYVFVGEDAFHLEEKFLTPYYADHLSEEQQVFNNRLDHVTRIAENTFDLLGSTFQILQKTINLQPEKARSVILATCYLHNYFRQKCPDEYKPIGIDDKECLQWQKKPPLQGLEAVSPEILSDTAQQIRDEFSLYFSNKDILDIKTEE